MKKVSILLAFTFLIIFLSSCLKTLHPIFTLKDIVYEAKLLGKWKTDNNGNKGFAIITNLAADNSIDLPEKISDVKQKGYLVSYTNEKGEIGNQFIAFLARIGNHLYFDYYPADKKSDQKLDEFFLAHYVKVHTSFKVDISNDGSFELVQLDDSYVTKLIEEKKFRISHEKDDEGGIRIITASTQELQQYLIKYGDDPAAYRNEKTKFTK